MIRIDEQPSWKHATGHPNDFTARAMESLTAGGWSVVHMAGGNDQQFSLSTNTMAVWLRKGN